LANRPTFCFDFFNYRKTLRLVCIFNAIVHWLTIIATITEHTRKAVRSKYLRYGLNIYNRRTIDGSKLGERDPHPPNFLLGFTLFSNVVRGPRNPRISADSRKIGIPDQKLIQFDFNFKHPNSIFYLIHVWFLFCLSLTILLLCCKSEWPSTFIFLHFFSCLTYFIPNLSLLVVSMKIKGGLFQIIWRTILIKQTIMWLVILQVWLFLKLKLELSLNVINTPARLLQKSGSY
jgi:hypothetical protein